ncbi:MAG: hypothetical protein RLY97_904, partial [Pseudomonadota bacterium]
RGNESDAASERRWMEILEVAEPLLPDDRMKRSFRIES